MARDDPEVPDWVTYPAVPPPRGPHAELTTYAECKHCRVGAWEYSFSWYSGRWSKFPHAPACLIPLAQACDEAAAR